jgi:hypothetical protein
LSKKRLQISWHELIGFVLIGLGLINILDQSRVAYNNTIDNILRTIFFSSAIIYFSLRKNKLGTLALYTLYLITYLSTSILSGVYWLDAINSCLFIIYFIGFYSFVDRLKYKRFEDLEWFYNLTLWLFFIVYFFFKIILDKNRPFLFVENNFELIFLGLIAFTKLSFKFSKFYYILFLFTIILSGSKSGLLILLLITIVIFNLRFALIPILTVAVFIFVSNFEWIQKIDRYTFFIHFMDVIVEHNFFLPMKLYHLPYSICQSLSFYTGSMDPDKIVCYPKILHSWILSSILNHGIIPIIFFLKTFYSFVQNQVIGKAGVFLLIGLVNGLSVSAFDNIWFWFSLSFIITVWKKHS